MINVQIEEDVKAFLKDIQERVKGQFNVYLGGGYLRDLYTLKDIKDIDVFFIPCNNEPTELGYIPAKWYVNYNKKLGEFGQASDMADRGVCQVIGLFNGGMSVTEAQFIVYEKFLTTEELAEDFDMNICQVVWDVQTEEITVTQDFLDGHNERFIECMQDYDLDRMYDRYVRMEKKFPEYQVSYDKPTLSELSHAKKLEILSGTDDSDDFEY